MFDKLASDAKPVGVGPGVFDIQPDKIAGAVRPERKADEVRFDRDPENAPVLDVREPVVVPVQGNLVLCRAPTSSNSPARPSVDLRLAGGLDR